MKFEELEITNVGPYEGRQTFSFSTDDALPLTVVWGHNGAGKTTILTALRLCLHGRDAFGSKITQSEYSDRLIGLFHRSSRQRAEEMEIALRFQYDRLGRRENVRVVRRWTLDEGRVRESLSLTGILGFSDLHDEHWSDFVREYMPPDIAGAFLFDAERVQELVDELSATGAMTGAVRSLLGLNLVSQLASDLRVLQSRMIRKLSDSPWEAKFEALHQERSQLVERFRASNDIIDGLTRSIEHLREQAANREAELRRHGGAFVDGRAAYQAELETWLQGIEDSKQAVTELLGGLAVFSFAGPLLDRLRDRLIAETDLAQWIAVQGLLADHRKYIHDAAKLEGIQGTQAERVIKVISDLAESYAESQPLVHDITASDRAATLGTIANVPMEKQELWNALQRLVTAKERAVVLERRLERAPEEDELQPILAKLSAIQQELGRKLAELAAETESNRLLSAEIETIDRRIQETQEEVLRNQAGELALANVAKVSAAAREIESRLGRTKANLLARALMETVPKLLAKQGMITGVDVEPGTFRITFRDQGDHVLDPSSFSEGEKQLVAISVLWALRKTSGRKLPVVIDTPLGRLDSVHRDRLVREYLPHVAKQVIVLSTDTEIGQDYSAQLDPYVGERLVVSYNADKGSSSLYRVKGWPDEYAV